MACVPVAAAMTAPPAPPQRMDNATTDCGDHRDQTKHP